MIGDKTFELNEDIALSITTTTAGIAINPASPTPKIINDDGEVAQARISGPVPPGMKRADQEVCPHGAHRPAW